MFIFAKISKTRRIIQILAAIFFFVSAVFILFFAFGYRFRQGIFIHSGTVTIKTVPQKVDIYFNGKLRDSKTYDIINNAYNLNGIKPGNYKLEIKKEGYSTWQKNIDVHSGFATEFWNIVLTPDQPESNRLDVVSPDYFKITEGSEKIVYSSRKNGPMEIFIYLPKKEKSYKIFEDTPNRKYAGALEYTEFSPSKDKLIMGIKENNHTTFYLALIDQIEKDGINEKTLFPIWESLGQAVSKIQEQKESSPNQIDLKSPLLLEQTVPESGENPDNPQEAPKVLTLADFKWLDNETFYFMNENNLFQTSLNQKEVSAILEDIRGYEISQNEIYYVKAPYNLVFKKSRYSAKDKQITENFIDQDFPKELSPFYKLTVYDEKRLVLVNQNQELYLFNDNEEEYQVFKKLNENIKGAQFSDDGKKLLYFSENEIDVYYLREWDVQPKNEVGARRKLYENKDQKIQDVMWHKNYQYVILSIDKEIKLIEIDTRDIVNESTIIKTQLGNPKATYDSLSEIIYYLDNSDKYIQLFEIEIPEE